MLVQYLLILGPDFCSLEIRQGKGGHLRFSDKQQGDVVQGNSEASVVTSHHCVPTAIFNHWVLESANRERWGGNYSSHLCDAACLMELHRGSRQMHNEQAEEEKYPNETDDTIKSELRVYKRGWVATPENNNYHLHDCYNTKLDKHITMLHFLFWKWIWERFLL